MVMEHDDSSCGEGACSVTSQSRALGSLSAPTGGSSVFGRKPMYAQRQTEPTLGGYGIPTLQLDSPHPAPAGAATEFFGGYSNPGPLILPSGEADVNVVRPAGQADLGTQVVRAAAQVVVPPAGLVLARPAGQAAPSTPSTSTSTSTSSSTPVKTPGMDAQISYTNGQAPQQQGGVQMDAQTATALAGLGSTLLAGTRDIVVAAITQGGESDRARARAQAEQEIARLRAQGLLTQDQAALAMQNTNTLLASQQQAAIAAALAAQQQQPQGFLASLSTGQKVALGVGGVALLGGIGFAIWSATRD